MGGKSTTSEVNRNYDRFGTDADWDYQSQGSEKSTDLEDRDSYMDGLEKQTENYGKLWNIADAGGLDDERTRLISERGLQRAYAEEDALKKKLEDPSNSASKNNFIKED